MFYPTFIMIFKFSCHYFYIKGFDF